MLFSIFICAGRHIARSLLVGHALFDMFCLGMCASGEFWCYVFRMVNRLLFSLVFFRVLFVLFFDFLIQVDIFVQIYDLGVQACFFCVYNLSHYL